MAPKRHAKPLYDFDGLVVAARRQGIDVKENNGHFYFSNKHGMVDMRREEVTAGRASWHSHVSRLRKIGLVWASRVERSKSKSKPSELEVIKTTYPSLAHVGSEPVVMFELPETAQVAVESAHVIEEIKRDKDMTEKDRGMGIGEKRHIDAGVPEGWSISESRTKEYKNRMHREARKFLRTFLKEGPKEIHEIKDAALAAGLTWYQVDRASNAIKIIKKGHGPRYPGTWELPERELRGLMSAAEARQSIPEGPSDEPSNDPISLDYVHPFTGARPPVSAEANGEPRNADPGPGTHPLPGAAKTGIVSPDETIAARQMGDAWGQRSPFALGIADLVEQELTFRVKEYVERLGRLESENSELRQQLADQKHEHDRNWDKIQQEALDAAQKSVEQAIAAAKKRS